MLKIKKCIQELQQEIIDDPKSLIGEFSNSSMYLEEMKQNNCSESIRIILNYLK